MIRDKVLGYLVGGVFVWPYPEDSSFNGDIHPGFQVFSAEALGSGIVEIGQRGQISVRLSGKRLTGPRASRVVVARGGRRAPG